MAASFPPNHPYNIMLYHVRKHLSGDKEKIIDLARIMGLRKFGTINNAPELFDKLEDEGCLSEFKVTELRKALDIIDLPEAAKKVKEYEENELEKKTNSVTSETPQSPVYDDPPPYRPPSALNSQEFIPSGSPPMDEVLETDLAGEETENEPNSTIPSTTTDKEPLNKKDDVPVEEIADLITKDFTKEGEKLPDAAKCRKYHTVSGKSSRQDYPALLHGIFPNTDK